MTDDKRVARITLSITYGWVDEPEYGSYAVDESVTVEDINAVGARAAINDAIAVVRHKMTGLIDGALL